jgi:hypothetical protein
VVSIIHFHPGNRTPPVSACRRVLVGDSPWSRKCLDGMIAPVKIAPLGCEVKMTTMRGEADPFITAYCDVLLEYVAILLVRQAKIIGAVSKKGPKIHADHLQVSRLELEEALSSLSKDDRLKPFIQGMQSRTK